MKTQIVTKFWIQPLRLLICFLAASCLQATIIHFREAMVDIVIPTSSDGIYLDVESGKDAICTPEQAEADFQIWDLKFTLGGALILSNDGLDPVQANTEWDGAVLNLAWNTMVDENRFYFDGKSGSEWRDHMGEEPSQFTLGEAGYFGFRFKLGNPSETVDYFYGWMRVTLDYTNGGRIHEWAYEDSGGAIWVGAVPEPATFGLLACLFGAVVVFFRRR